MARAKFKKTREQKMDIAASLLQANPQSSKLAIGKKMTAMGVLATPKGVYNLWTSEESNRLETLKKRLQAYAQENIVGPAYVVHARELQKIDELSEKNKKPIEQKYLQTVIAGERLAGDQVDINITEVVDVRAVHAIFRQEYMDMVPGAKNVTPDKEGK